jgi:hypothetical protein
LEKTRYSPDRDKSQKRNRKAGVACVVVSGHRPPGRAKGHPSPDEEVDGPVAYRKRRCRASCSPSQPVRVRTRSSSLSIRPDGGGNSIKDAGRAITS